MNMTATDTQAQFAQDLQEATADVTDKIVLVDETLRGLIKRQPVAAVGVALLAGFIVGRIATRL